MKAETPQRRRRLPICVYQRRYWAKWSQRPRSSAFNTSMVFVMSGGRLDRQALRRACDFVLQAHEMFHATFTKDGSEQYHAGFGIDDVYSERDGVAADRVEREVKELLNEPFDLESGPLVRFHLLGCQDGRSYFLVNGHHVLADAASAKIVVPQIMAAYAASLGGRALTPAAYSYADCVEALHAAQTPEKEAAARAFWKAYLEGAPSTVAFPRRAAPVPDDQASESIYFDLDRSVTEALRGFARDHGSTLFVVLFALYGVLLAKYAGQRTVVISYPVNMRPQGHAHVLGCFVNLLVKRIALRPETTFRMLVEELTEQQRAAKPHMFYQLGDLVRERGEVSADIERSFFSVFFGETYLNTRPLALGDLRVEMPDIPWSQEFDRELRLLYDPGAPERLKFRMDFRTGLFDREMILSFIEELRQLAGRLIHDERPLCELAGSSSPGW